MKREVKRKMAKVGRKKRDETVRVSYRLNAELEQHMREYCEANGLIMSRFLESALREKLEREDKK